MTVKTPNFFLTESYTYFPNGWGGEGRTLPVNASVRPIELPYVPKDVTEHTRWKDFDKNKEVFCFCRYGIIAIPKHIIVEK